MIHELKIYPGYFESIIQGVKTFEVRKDDRGYRLGDYIALNEYIPGNPEGERYTGRSSLYRIIHLLSDPEFCKEGYVVLGITLCGIVESVPMEYEGSILTRRLPSWITNAPEGELQ